MARDKRRAGALRERIELQHQVRESDGAGGWHTKWEPYATVWGSVDAVSSGERMFAERIQGEITHRIVIRYRDDIEFDDRIVWRGYEIRFDPPRNVESRDRWLEFDAVLGEAVSTGEEVS